MQRFLTGHATHPDGHVALALAAAQIEAQRETGRARTGAAGTPTLGFAYLSEAYVPIAEALLAELRQRWPGVEWVGASGVGIAAGGVEYFAEPALALMLAELPRSQFRVYSGARPLRDFPAEAALVHADPATPDLGELIGDLSARTASGYLFGGLASGGSSESRTVHLADGVWHGGLSGVAFAREVGLVSRVTQGCRPLGATRVVTEVERQIVARLDGTPALDALLADLGLAGREPREVVPALRQVLVGLSAAPAEAARTLDAAATRPSGPRDEPGADVERHDPSDSADPGRRDAFGTAHAGRRGAFGIDVRVRHLVGIDPDRRALAIAEAVEPGTRLTFCVRHAEAARRDLTRICAEIREELEPETLTPAAALAWKEAADALGDPADPAAGPPAASGIAGAIYVSCAGRGGPHFGAPSAELAIVRHALGDVPLVGFFAAGEIAHHHLYGYTGVLTVFRSDLETDPS